MIADNDTVERVAVAIWVRMHDTPPEVGLETELALEVARAAIAAPPEAS